MFNNPLNEKALAASTKRRQQLDHLLRVTAPHERLVLAGIGLILFSLGVWALFGSIVRSVELDGVLIEPGKRHEVVSTEPGHLIEFLAAPGQRIAAGEVIARQSVPELQRETDLLRDRVAQLESESQASNGDAGSSGARLSSARVALRQSEARRTAKEWIVSQIGGEVMALRSAPGQYLPTGTAIALIREAESQPLQAVAGVDARMSRRLRPGMRASVEVALPDGETRRLVGEVAEVAAGALPGWFLELQPASAGSGYRVDVSLEPDSELPVPDGTPGRIRIVLGRQTPATLLGLGNS
ncbi:MAG: HlyD family efflux transporter periplasmic adaptor subunit [Proteobacteria bacterium]|nr:HlyD family efflux transporter periplasmic adaptor subunit [Pseudomonadota bacterium]